MRLMIERSRGVVESVGMEGSGKEIYEVQCTIIPSNRLSTAALILNDATSFRRET
jgi:hypothetical protein